MHILTAITTGARHAAFSVLQGTLVVSILASLALAVGAVTGSPAGAGATVARNAYSITVNAPSGASAATTAIHFGDTIGTVSSYAKADPVYVRVSCVSGSATISPLPVGSTVYDVYKSIREGSWNTGGAMSFTLSSSAWTGGWASCTAALRTYSMHNANRVWTTLASQTFAVLP